MESQPQNPEFRKNPENFHQCSCISTFFENKRVMKALDSSPGGTFVKASWNHSR